MTALHRCPTPFRDILAELTAKTDLRLDVFILPITGNIENMTGMAWRDGPDGLCCITICGRKPMEHLQFVLLHELAHHLYLDTAGWSSEPMWIQEYRADQFALRHLKDIVHPDTYWALDQYARAHVRPLLQRMIDADIWNHVDLTVADWAGCDMTDDMRKMLTEPQTTDYEGIVF